MRNSFLAVISCRGLESFVPESEKARFSLARTVEKHSATCLWTVMERTRAIIIYDLLEAGETRRAEAELAQAAEFMGPVLGFPSIPSETAT